MKKKSNAKTYLIGLLGLAATAALIMYPEPAYEASKYGLDVWWNIVFPALLPFFLAAEILTGLGVVHFIGVLMEPLMRPLFRVPGIGAFVLAVGLASGYPMGATLSAEHRLRGDISKEEGERLMAFTNTADPLFMFGAVAVGMLGWPEIGYTLAIAHYLGCLCTGLLMRSYKPKTTPTTYPKSREFVLHRAAKALITARKKDNRPFGKLMGDAITKSMNSLLLVGGFIIGFSVLNQMLVSSGLLGLLASVLSTSTENLLLVSNGLLEMTIGCQQAVIATIPLTTKIVIISAVIAWSGLSVHGQVASIVSKTDLSMKPYFVGRVIHGMLAAIFTAILFHLNWVPALPTAVIEYVHLSLVAKYWLSVSLLIKVMVILAGIGLVLLVKSMLTNSKLAFFRVGQRRN